MYNIASTCCIKYGVQVIIMQYFRKTYSAVVRGMPSLIVCPLPKLQCMPSHSLKATVKLKCEVCILVSFNDSITLCLVERGIHF